MSLPDHAVIKQQVQAALQEDLGGEMHPTRDITAALIPAQKQAEGYIITREPAVICGIAWASESFHAVCPDIRLHWHVTDGDSVAANTQLLTFNGPARAILTAERTALNFLQTLSGTATLTARYLKHLEGSRTQLLDTRKTLPGLRLAQKYAVRCGGGKNHRIGLFDAYLIKENHILACGSIASAIAAARQAHVDKWVEVEVETLAELQQAIAAGADVIMLDNFTDELIAEAVAINNQRCKLEVSGNITDERLARLSQLGVDYVSSGALTKHVQAIDLSLRINM